MSLPCWIDAYYEGGSSDNLVPMVDLRTAINRALDAVENEFGDTVAVPWDYYWHLWADAAFDPYESPPEDRFTTGSISDDIEWVQDWVAREVEDDHVVIWSDLMHAIGHRASLERLDDAVVRFASVNGRVRDVQETPASRRRLLTPSA